jgi:hypothetical protein
MKSVAAVTRGWTLKHQLHEPGSVLAYILGDDTDNKTSRIHRES